jgi:hypothetical protein
MTQKPSGVAIVVSGSRKGHMESRPPWGGVSAMRLRCAAGGEAHPDGLRWPRQEVGSSWSEL